MLNLRNGIKVATLQCIQNKPFSTSFVIYKERGLVRRPLRVWNPQDAQKLAKVKSVEILDKPKNRNSDNLFQKKFTLPTGISYTQLTDDDKRFRLALSAKSRKDRIEKGIILLEGKRLICDAIDAGAKIKAIYFSKVEHLEGIPLESIDAELYKSSYKQLQFFSEVVTSTGLMAIAKLPNQDDLIIPTQDLLPLTLICDNIRDPGNMGTIIRSAAAVGCQRVIVTRGCMNLWDPKVLRAGAGSHFRCHVIEDVTWHMIPNYLSESCLVCLADSNPRQFQEGGRRRVKKTMVESEPPEELEESDMSVDYTETPTTSNDKHPTRLTGEIKILETLSVYDVDFTAQEAAIVIGGETHGLSPLAYKLASNFDGVNVHLPMIHGVNSLNAAMAATGILFEVKRQFMLKEAFSALSDGS